MDDNRCKATEHDYHPLPRERRGQTIVGLDGADTQTTTYDIEPPRLYCQKCGWIHDIRS